MRHVFVVTIQTKMNATRRLVPEESRLLRGRRAQRFPSNSSWSKTCSPSGSRATRVSTAEKSDSCLIDSTCSVRYSPSKKFVSCSGTDASSAECAAAQIVNWPNRTVSLKADRYFVIKILRNVFRVTLQDTSTCLTQTQKKELT